MMVSCLLPVREKNNMRLLYIVHKEQWFLIDLFSSECTLSCVGSTNMPFHTGLLPHKINYCDSTLVNEQ